MPAFYKQFALRFPWAAVFSLVVFAGEERSNAQSGRIQVGSQRPFVTGLIPVVGPGVVGGVKVDAKGIVRLATTADIRSIKKAREAALRDLRKEVARGGKLRKVSLRRLNAALLAKKKAGKPISGAMRHLAGLQRVRYLFVYPEVPDIILVGPADGLKVGDDGDVVGTKSGLPPLLLDDLIVALRNAHTSKSATMSCSIDPTRRGVLQFRRLLARKGLRVNRATLRAMERAMGPQKVTIDGITPSTHFAHVMLAADLRMKRLAMGLEKSPVAGLPAYLDLLRNSSGSPPKNMMPRWWLQPDYQPLRKDTRSVAWEIRGRGVKAMTDKGAHPLARKWAEAMTRRYAQLSEKIPVFARLQNCMDLAVVSTIIAEYEFLKAVDLKLDMLMNDKQLQAAKFPTPTRLASHAGAFRKGGKWIISISGGVKLSPSTALDKTARLEETGTYKAIAPKKTQPRWWWD